eukprot:gene12927-14918_t
MPTTPINQTLHLFGYAPSNITILSVDASTTMLSVNVGILGRVGVYVHCAAFYSPQQPLRSVSEVIVQNQFTLATSSNVTVQLANLLPATNYTVFCTSATVQGSFLSLAVVQSTRVTVTTISKKSIFVRVLQPTIYEFATTENVVQISYDALPLKSVEVAVELLGSSGTSVYPALYAIRNNSGFNDMQNLFAVSAGAAGEFQVDASLSGESAEEYQVVYSTQSVVRVINATTAPSVPEVGEARFSADGTQITVSFDAPTDQAGFDRDFQCDDLLQFDGADTASCAWASTSRINIYPRYDWFDTINEGFLSVGSLLTVRASWIRAACSPLSQMDCNLFETVQNTTVTLLPPEQPAAPIVVLSVPRHISSCVPLTVDLSSSLGSAGRNWRNVSFLVLTDGGASVPAVRLEDFLNRNFTFNPPTSVPVGVVKKGYTYAIKATLCNFLDACGGAVQFVTKWPSVDLVPTVSIAGLDRRTILRSSTLVITSKAIVRTCLGDVSYANLQQSWRMFQVTSEGSPLVNINSTSQNPTVFRLSPHTLQAGAQYLLVLSATSLITTLSSSAQISVTVSRGAIVAAIAGGSDRFVEVNETFLLDASSSYDEDIPIESSRSENLTFAWSCVQIEPVYGAGCPLTLPLVSGGASILNVTATTAALNTTSRVTVRVSDATRSSTASVTVTVTTVAVAKLDIQSPNSLSNVNSAKPLVLLGTISGAVSCAAAWSVDSTDFLLAEASLSPTTSIVTSASALIVPHVFNLVLRSGALDARSTYVFSLSCGQAYTSVTVTTNGAPLPGVLAVSPDIGVELSTTFALSALGWSDADVPLSYQFGFISPGSLDFLSVAGGATESAFVITTLPAGDAPTMQLKCMMRAFDSLGASVTASDFVTVLPSSTSAQQLHALQNLIANSAESVNDKHQAVTVASAVLNAVNCTAAPDCTALNRHPCQSTSGQCGACVSGYAGDTGARNTACLPVSLLLDNTGSESTLCATQNDCLSWQQCDLVTLTCVAPVKTCINDCSSHGRCLYANRVTGAPLSQCRMNDLYCDAICACSTGYSGEACQIAETELNSARIVRSALLTSLFGLTTSDDINEHSVIAWAASLASLAQLPYELSITDADKVLQLANITMNTAMMLQLDYNDFVTILDAVNSVFSIRKLDYDPNDYNANGVVAVNAFPNNTAEATVNIVGLFAELLLQSHVLGQPVQTYVYDNFRLTAGLHSFVTENGNVSLTIPSSELEIAANQSTSRTELAPLGQNTPETVLSSTAILVYPRAYTPNTQAFVSNPTYLRLKSVGDTSAPPRDYLSEATFSFPNLVSNPVFDTRKGDNFTSYCTSGNLEAFFTHDCPGSNVQLVHNCSLGPGIYTSYCPLETPACANVALSTAVFAEAMDCAVREYSADATTCVCRFTSPAASAAKEVENAVAPRVFNLRGKRHISEQAEMVDFSPRAAKKTRRLQTDNDFMSELGVSNMATTTAYRTDADGTSYVPASGPGEIDQGSTFVVVVTVSSLWAVGLFVLLISFARASNTDKKKLATIASSNTSLEKMLTYVESLIPPVFAESPSFVRRMGSELLRHHALGRLLDPRVVTDEHRQESVCKLVSTLTFMLFLVCVLFDQASPDDDGSCENHFAFSDCVERVSYFDTEHTYCTWRQNSLVGECVYAPQELTTIELIYLAIAVCVLTSLSTLTNDFLFRIITSPTQATLRLVRNQTRNSTLRSSFRANMGSFRPRNLAGVAPEPLNVNLIPIRRKSSVVGDLFLDIRGERALRHIPAEVALCRDAALSGPKDVANGEFSESSRAFNFNNKVAPEPIVTDLLHEPVSEKSKLSAAEDEVRLAGSTKSTSFRPALSPPVPVVRSLHRHHESNHHIQTLKAQETLREAVLTQRQCLRNRASATVEYDKQWGLHPSVNPMGCTGANSQEHFFDPQALSVVYNKVVSSDREARRLNKD